MEDVEPAQPSFSGIEPNDNILSSTDSTSSLEGISKNLEGVGLGTPNTSPDSDPSETAVNTTSSLSNDKGKQSSSSIPYALTWSEREMHLKPARSIGDSGRREMTRGVFPRWEFSCSGIPNSNGEFIIFGGRAIPDKAEIWTDDVILMSTADMSLTSLETNGTKPEAKTGHRAVIAGRVLVVFGGNTDDTYLRFLNLDTREWSNLRPPAPYPGPRFGHSFIIVDSTIWLYGGGLTGAKMDDMWCIHLGTDGIEYVRWRQILKREPWPLARSYHSTVYYDGCLYIFGGQGVGETKTYLNDLWKFDIRAETWTEIQCQGFVPQPRTSHTAETMGDNMFVFGGVIAGEGAKEGNAVRTDDAFVFNFPDYTWQSLAMLGRPPVATKSGVMLTLGSRLCLVGGQAGKKSRIHMAEIRGASSLPDSLAKLQFTTETTKLKFTTEVVDLSRFIRKQGDAAHSLAGFSDVWKGEMTETGKPIAIKVLRVARTSSPDDPESGRLRTRFDRELTIWMECQHPRVLELLGFAYIEGIPCLISPWCSNGNVMEYLSKNPGADRRRLIHEVAEGLVYLHAREPPVVHSDIKPANVVVSDEGNAKICDFGISKLVSENPSGFTTTASVKGTLRYSSPEMLDLDGKSTTTSDVWAFGMLILHVMTGKLPYIKLLSDPMVIMAIMNGKTPLPENYSELPTTDPLWGIIRKCWQGDPVKRPTMAEVFKMLPERTGS